MRKYKQIQRKEVIYSLDEWKLIEERTASVLMKMGMFIKRMSLDGHITFFNMTEVGEVMKALRIAVSYLQLTNRLTNRYTIKESISLC